MKARTLGVALAAALSLTPLALPARAPRVPHSDAYHRMVERGLVKQRAELGRANKVLRVRVNRLRSENRKLARQVAELTRPGPAWATARVTSYATWEFGGHLDGCNGSIDPATGRPGCNTGCSSFLHDDEFTVADNALACGTRIILSDGIRSHTATVTDRTGSPFDMELSYALSRVFGAPDQEGVDLTWTGVLFYRRL